jgi:hypothetical protein
MRHFYASSTQLAILEEKVGAVRAIQLICSERFPPHHPNPTSFTNAQKHNPTTLLFMKGGVTWESVGTVPH